MTFFRKMLVVIALASICLLSVLFYWIYEHDKSLYKPRLWIGFFDYRLNFRDVGQSLNGCLGQDVFRTGKIYRSNRYFSGWDCEKINNPQKIYSLNFSPWNPHAYYCALPNGQEIVGLHPNTDFEISDIERISNWNSSKFRESMCWFVKENIRDLIEKRSFLFHCDMGQDRTGAYSALLASALAGQAGFRDASLVNAIECDYEKTHSLEKEKRGRMINFIKQLEIHGGSSLFLQKQCGIKASDIYKASQEFMVQKRS